MSLTSCERFAVVTVTVTMQSTMKGKCRSRLIEHAVRCLTTDRSTSVCVQRDHVREVWRFFRRTGEARAYFSPEQMLYIEDEIKQWELFHESQVQSRKPSDLRVCYLAGDNPVDDLKVFTNEGVLSQNIWAIEKDAEALKNAWDNICRSDLTTRNVRLFKGDFLNFLKDFEGQFDIIYYDACGSLPSAKQKTLKVIGYVFLYNKLTSPGALITNFSFPPKQAAQVQNAPTLKEEAQEAKRLRKVSEDYLKYRLVNEASAEANPYIDTNSEDTNSKDKNTPSKNAKYLGKRTDEEIYSDYITYQVIDSASLFIPAQRLLSSTRSGGSCPLWEQMFVKKEDFLKEVKIYDMEATASESLTASKSPAGSESNATSYSKSSAGSESLNAASKFELSAVIESNAASKSSAASESHAVSKSSAASESNAVSKSSAASESNAVSKSSAASESNAASKFELSAVIESNAANKSSAASESNAASKSSAASESNAVSKSSAASESNAASKSPAISESNVASKSSAASESNAVSKSSAASESNAASKSSAVSESNAVSKSSAVSESNAASKSSAASESNAVSKSSAASESNAVSKSSAVSESNAVSKSSAVSESNAYASQVLEWCKAAAKTSYLRKIGSSINSNISTKKDQDSSSKALSNLFKALEDEIFPDLKSSEKIFKCQKLSTLLLTPLLSYSPGFILKFTNKSFQSEKCLKDLFTRALDGEPISTNLLQLLDGLLYGQMAYPSFPVLDKMLRLSYTAKQRQMFSDVFIFDKCRYVYEQCPSVECSGFALFELEQHMVLKMVVDGLRDHLSEIFYNDLFPSGFLTTIAAMVNNGEESVDHNKLWYFLKNQLKFPKREKLND